MALSMPTLSKGGAHGKSGRSAKSDKSEKAPKLDKPGKGGAFGRRESKAAIARSMPEKLWLVGGGVVALLLVVLGYFTFIHGQQQKTSDVRSQITDAQSQNSALQARLAQLHTQNADLPKYAAALAKAQLALPSSADASNFVRTLQAIGNSTGATVSGVTFASPVAMTQNAPAAAAPSDSSSATAATGASATPAASIYSMQITAQVTGGDVALVKFLQQLQAVQPRAVLLSSVGLGADSGTSGSASVHSLSLTMQAFVQPTNLTVPTSAVPTPAASS